MYSDTPDGYPLFVVEQEFACVSQPIKIYILASLRHFCILVPLNNSVPISPKVGPENPHACIFDELVSDFYTLTEEYLQHAHEYNTSLPLPEIDLEPRAFFGEFVTLEGGMSLVQGDFFEVNYLDLAGEHLFIAEVGTTIEEFLGSTQKEN